MIKAKIGFIVYGVHKDGLQDPMGTPFIDDELVSKAKKSLIEAYTSQGILAYRRDELSKALSAWQKVLIIDKDQPMIKRYIKRAVNKRKNLKRLFGE